MSIGFVGFYFNVFVVPKHTDGIHLTLNLKWFNHYMHIPTSKMPTIMQVWQHIQQGDYALSVNLQGPYLHIPINKHCCNSNFVYSW